MQSTSGSATSSCQREYHRRAPMSAANAAASSGRPRLTATMSQEGESISAGATRLRTMSPAPIRPQRTGSEFMVPGSAFVLVPGSIERTLNPEPGTPNPSLSELQLHCHLHLTLGRAAERARRARQHRRDRAERRVAELRVRVRELRMIQQVEHFDSELGG